MVRRNKIDDITFPELKVMMWERFDTSKKRRNEIAYSSYDASSGSGVGSQNFAPNWNNPGADPNIGLVDGSVIKYDLELLYTALRDNSQPKTQDALAPTDLWNPTFPILNKYAMGRDNLENGSASDPGVYPAFFWATRDGVQGRDIIR